MVTNLGAVRAIRSGDARKMKPVDLLRHLLSEIEAGTLEPSKLAVLWFEGEPETYTRGAAFAGLDRVETIALLDVTHADIMDAWRNG